MDDGIADGAGNAGLSGGVERVAVAEQQGAVEIDAVIGALRFQPQAPRRRSQIGIGRSQQGEVQAAGIVGAVKPHLARIHNGQIITAVVRPLHARGHRHPAAGAGVLIVGDLGILIAAQQRRH